MMKRVLLLFVFSLLAIAAYFNFTPGYGYQPPKVEVAPAISATGDAQFYTEKIQPIFNNRCIACHSCLESPCQLNLQAYEGVLRGSFHEMVYNGKRIQASKPTRLFEDASTFAEWRERGFYDVIGNSNFSILQSMLDLSQKRNDRRPKKQVEDSFTCPEKPKVYKAYEKTPEMAMPYGLPALEAESIENVRKWIAMGAPGPVRNLEQREIPQELQNGIFEWENFLNQKDLKSQVVARYLFEHLFLAHFYVPQDPKTYFRLVRSKTPCQEKISVISSRTPNQDPGVKDWYYCFQNDRATVVLKNHIPYELSKEKLKFIKDLFLTSPWTPTEFPSFKTEIASNPFLTFKEIPPVIRYKFLLEDARYHVMTFIKGPVCNGTQAVNSIQEQFFVFFTDPSKEMMSINPKFAEKVAQELILPGQFGSEVKLTNIVSTFQTLLTQRNNYRSMKYQYLEESGDLSLKAIWDGNGHNKNAVLTVFRHNQSAEVVWGARGDLPKTAFLLDYPLFERLVYNLVVNFDVYGNVGHQLLSRLYMDLIRMEAENNFINYLPLSERLPMKRQWYQGQITSFQLELLNENMFLKKETQVPFEEKSDFKAQLFRKILFERLPAKVVGGEDAINWKELKPVSTKDPVLQELRKMASVRAREKSFPQYFPDFSVLLVKMKDQKTRVYSIIRNNEHTNIAWILNEDTREDLSDNSLSILESIRGSYPNQFIVVKEEDVASFVSQVLQIKSYQDYRLMIQKWGVDRMAPHFWATYDEVNSWLVQNRPLESGFLDLSRYQMELAPAESVLKFLKTEI